MYSPRAVAVLLVVAVSCSSGSPSTSGTTAATTPESSGGPTAVPDTVERTTPESTDTTVPAIPMPVFDAGLLPAVPPPTPLAGVDPPSRAIELVAATSDQSDDVGAGWVAVYTELAIPVIDPAGVSTIADDPLGPRFDHVWSIGGLSRGEATLPLSDLGTTLTLDETTAIDPAVLLADLRAAVLSTDPRVQTFGLFVADKVVDNGGADLRDPTVTTDQVALDAATIQLISWVVIRDAFQAGVTEDLASYSPVSGFANPQAIRRAAATPCAEALGTADETSWINWLLGKAGGGVGIDGVASTPGLVEAMVAQMKKATEGVDAAKKASAKAAKLISRMNIIASVLSLAAQVNAVKIDLLMEPDPLVRNRQTTDGKTADIAVSLSFSSDALNSNLEALCTLSIVANALGVGLSFVADGAPLANVEVIVTSGKNFGTKVYFGANADRKRVTNGKGVVNIEVQGKARAKAVPASAKEKDDEFGLNFEAQVEELTAASLLNVFIDGLSLTAGAASGALDIAKSYHFDLGEFVFRFIDYQQGYIVSVASSWHFEESGLGLSAVFDNIELQPTESGTYTATADVKWGVIGTIGTPGCGLTQAVEGSSATLTGVEAENGELTVTVDYGTSTIHNVSTCGPVTREGTVAVAPGQLVIVGASGQTLQGALEHVIFAGTDSRSGVADYSVVPMDTEGS